jgi:hypothetical protein
MSDTRKIAGRTVVRATTDKRPQVTVGDRLAHNPEVAGSNPVPATSVPATTVPATVPVTVVPATVWCHRHRNGSDLHEGPSPRN